MKSHTVGIYYFRMTADSSKVKSTFAFLNEVFHLAPATVKLDDLIRFHIHVCNNKGVHMRQLTVWFFNLENHAPWIIPGAGLIQKFAISYSIADRNCNLLFLSIFFSRR